MTSDYMDTREAAIYLRFVDARTGEPKRQAVREFLASQRVPVHKRGRITLYRIADVQATVRARDAR